MCSWHVRGYYLEEPVVMKPKLHWDEGVPLLLYFSKVMHILLRKYAAHPSGIDLLFLYTNFNLLTQIYPPSPTKQ
jgi:hypothetical protein